MISTRYIHWFSGILLSAFIGIHFLNHLSILLGADTYLQLMQFLRKIYRHPVIETLLLAAVIAQVISGIRLLLRARKRKQLARMERLRIYSGIYLAFFLLGHTGAVLAARSYGIDTNLYFGALVVNTFPLYFFYVPYYMLGVIAVFTHIAATHQSKMLKRDMLYNGKAPAILIVIGCIAAVLIISGLTGHFRGLDIPHPEEYQLYK